MKLPAAVLCRTRASFIARVTIVTWLWGMSCTGPVSAATPICHEMRAVWLTTVDGIDWPSSTNPAEQRSSLLRIVQSLRQANVNTIFFQARARGDSYYRSDYEPWAAELTGKMGRDPGWDPMGFLIEAAHAEGIDVHAWVNVFKVRSNDKGEASSSHPTRKFPDWIIRYQGEDWLDPGYPGVRRYLVNVIVDLVRKYDLDGINLDYARYPGEDFPDGQSWALYGRKGTRGTWRVENVNSFIEAVYDSCAAIKPWLKVGSSPLGVPASASVPGSAAQLRQYSQDAPSWIARGKQDYLSPQIYWSLTGQRRGLCFDELVTRWKDVAAGRQMVAGIALFKPEVRAELNKEIVCAQKAGFSGVAFFRYGFFSSSSLGTIRYERPALVPPMPWKCSGKIPSQPTRIDVSVIGGTNILRWNTWHNERPWRFAIYRVLNSIGDRTLVSVVPGSTTSFSDDGIRKGEAPLAYEVTALDRFGMESTAGMASLMGPVGELAK